jgi:hypothetical protein
MQKLLLVVAIPLVFLCVLVAVENPVLGWLGFVAPVALFVWLLRRMQHAPAPGHDRAPAMAPVEPGDDIVVDAIFDDDASAHPLEGKAPPVTPA